MALSIPVATHAAETTVTWQGFSNSESRVWTQAQFWEPQVVPNNGGGQTYAVVIPNNGNIGPSLESAVTINSLLLSDGAGFSANAGNAGADLTVLGTTYSQPEIVNGQPIFGGMEVRNSTYTLGDYLNFDNGVLLAGVIRIERGSQSGILQFKGADIVENKAQLSLFGSDSPLGDAIIRDQNTLADGLRHFAVNSGTLTLNGGYQRTTAGDFTNHGGLEVIGNDVNNPSRRTTFTVNGNLTNDGQLEFIAAGRIVVTGNMTNSGSVFFASGSTGTLEVAGVITQTAGTFILGDVESFRATAERIDLAAGTTFGGRGTLLADLVEGGVFAPGASPGRITVQGDVTLQGTAELQIELGGRTAGTQFDQVVQDTQTGGDGVTLGGTLTLTLVDGFAASVTPADVFAILTSDVPLDGAFTNVPSGGRLTTADGAGSFRVTYAGLTQVVLSDFQAVPEPAGLAVLAGVGVLAARRRR